MENEEIIAKVTKTDITSVEAIIKDYTVNHSQNIRFNELWNAIEKARQDTAKQIFDELESIAVARDEQQLCLDIIPDSDDIDKDYLNLKARFLPEGDLKV